MGYLTEKYSTIFRGPWITYMKERRNSRIAVRLMNHLYKEIFIKIPTQIKDHRVTKALKEIRKVIKESKIVEEKEHKFAFEIAYQEEGILSQINKIEDELLRFINEVKKENKNLSEKMHKELLEVYKLYSVHIGNAMRKLKQYDKSEYKDVLVIIGQDRTKNKKTFMEEMKKLLLDVKTSRWRSWAMRGSTIKFRKEIRIEKREKKEIETLIKELMHLIQTHDRKNKIFTIIDKLKQVVIKLEKHLVAAFYDAYNALKRDFRLVYLLLYYITELKKYLTTDELEHLLPKAPIEGVVIKDVNTLEDVMIAHVRNIAQAFRRIYQEERRIEAKTGQLGLPF